MRSYEIIQKGMKLCYGCDWVYCCVFFHI